MIQFNLLPDVKQEFIKARYRKRLIAFVAIVAAGAAMIIVTILFLYVRVAQKNHMEALSKDITSSLNTLKKTPDLDKILTIQNQLSSLPELHDKKIVSSRLVDYLSQLTPSQATISDALIDFDASTMSIKGNADTLSTVNKFADTLKFTDYKLDGDKPKEGKAFSSVVLKTFAITPPTATQPGGQVSYELTFSFDPIIFESSASQGGAVATLNVPKIISTRSETEKPAADLFSPQPTQDSGTGQ